jgi:hypothetical protein
VVLEDSARNAGGRRPGRRGLKAGATVVPLNILLTEREIAYHLDDSAARAYFCFEGTPELPPGAAITEADLVAWCDGTWPPASTRASWSSATACP